MPLTIRHRMSTPFVRRDDFARANSTDLGPYWNPLPGVSDCNMQIISGVVHPVLGNSRGDEWRNDFPAPMTDQFSQVTLAAWTGTIHRRAGILLRQSPTIDRCYEMSVTWDPGPTQKCLIAIVYPTDPFYQDLTITDFVANVGDVLRGEVQGTTLRFYINGTQVRTITDATYADGYPGFAAIADAGAPRTDTGMDNWSGGPL